MVSVLFVCLGNICRSPLAEAVFKALVHQRGLDHLVSCDSAGTVSAHLGEQSDYRARKAASNHGVHLDHIARAFSAADFIQFDYIFPMDHETLMRMDRIRPAHPTAKVMLMRKFDTEEKGTEVPDPYYGDQEDFEETYVILNRCCKHFIDHLIAEHSWHEQAR